MRMPKRTLTAKAKKIVRIREGLDVLGIRAELILLPHCVDVNGFASLSRIEDLLWWYRCPF